MRFLAVYTSSVRLATIKYSLNMSQYLSNEMKCCVKFQTAINSSRKLKQNTRKRKEEKGFLDKSKLLKIPDCRSFSVLRKTLTGYRPYSHSVFEQKSPFISFFLCTVFVNKTKSNRFTLSLHCFYFQSCVFMV